MSSGCEVEVLDEAEAKSLYAEYSGSSYYPYFLKDARMHLGSSEIQKRYCG